MKELLCAVLLLQIFTVNKGLDRGVSDIFQINQSDFRTELPIVRGDFVDLIQAITFHKYINVSKILGYWLYSFDRSSNHIEAINTPKLLKSAQSATSYSYETIYNIRGSQHRMLKSVPQDLYFIQSNEGVIAHLRELATLSDIMSIYSRRIIAMSFQSMHYPDIDKVNICNLFNLPENILCDDSDLSRIITRFQCVQSGYHSTPYDLQRNNMKDSLITTTNFHYKDIECFVGELNYSVGIYDANKLTKQPMGIRTFSIKPYYDMKFYKILDILQTTASRLCVVHWRRGDQLTQRCNTKSGRHYDTSVNCLDVDSFVRSVKSNLQRYVENYHEYTIYIATNEQSTVALQEISRHNYKLFNDIKYKLGNAQFSMTSLDIFMLELVMMCSSKYYMAWGASSIHRYVAGYRLTKGLTNSSFIYNNELGYYIYN